MKDRIHKTDEGPLTGRLMVTVVDVERTGRLISVYVSRRR